MHNSISQNLPQDLEDKIKVFRAEVSAIFDNSDFPLQFICNMDETPVYLDLLPGKVVSKKGRKSIKIRTTASEKNRVTVYLMLCCFWQGAALIHYFQRKNYKEYKKSDNSKGCCVHSSAKSMDG